MASTATCALATPAITDGKNVARAQTTHAVGLPALPASPAGVASVGRFPAASYCRKMARNMMGMATASGEASTQVEDTYTTELPEIIKTVQEAWEKVEDKYAASALGVAGFIALWSSAGMISAIDRLPVVPGVMELVGIGYTGWFAYKNLVFKPDRQALKAKIKNLYNDMLGSS